MSCDLCRGKMVTNQENDNKCAVQLFDKEITIYAISSGWNSMKVTLRANYCPVCGSKLGDSDD